MNGKETLVEALVKNGALFSVGAHTEKEKAILNFIEEIAPNDKNEFFFVTNNTAYLAKYNSDSRYYSIGPVKLTGPTEFIAL